MTAETGKHTKAQSAHSGIFRNRDLIKDISVQRRVSATFTYNLHPHNTPENAYLMAIHAHWARIVNRKPFAHSGRFVSHKNTTNRRGNMTSLHRIFFDKTAAVFVSFPLLYYNVCLRLPQYKPCNIDSVMCTLKYSDITKHAPSLHLLMMLQTLIVVCLCFRVSKNLSFQT